MAVTPTTIAAELGRSTPVSPQLEQWQRWIDRARRTVTARADLLGVPFDSLDPDTVDDVVTYAVVRRISRPIDGAESTTDQIGVDDGTWNQTRRYPTGMGDIHVLPKWWEMLGLALPESVGWSGSVSYVRR